MLSTIIRSATICRVSNSRSGVSFSKIATGRNFKRKLLQEDCGILYQLFSCDRDVTVMRFFLVGYVLDTGFHVFFWVGRNASEQIRTAGFKRAKVRISEISVLMVHAW